MAFTIQLVSPPLTGTPVGEAQYTDFSFTQNLNKPSTLSFSMSGFSEGNIHLGEMDTDVMLYEDRALRYRGRVTGISDTIDESDHKVSVSSSDYRSLLNRRITWTDLAYTQTEQTALGFALITYAQQRNGGDLGITRGVLQTSDVLRDRTYPAGSNILKILDELSNVVTGFEWEIDQWRKFNVWNPFRGTSTTVIAAHGSNVNSITRQTDPSTYANAVRSSGATGVTAAGVELASLADVANPLPQGRFDLQEGNTDVTTYAVLLEGAQGKLASMSALNPSYTLQMTPGTWSYDSIHLGDTIRVVVRSGRLDINELQRVQGIALKVGSDGVQRYTLTVGVSRDTDPLLNQFRDVNKRLNQLARR